MKTRVENKKISALRIALVAVAGAALFSACSDDSTAPVSPPPEATSVVVTANPLNTLSSVVTFNTKNVESARVLYKDSTGVELTTPYYPVTGPSAQIVTLGLLDTTTYAHRVEVAGPGGTTISASVDFTSGQLPDTLNAVDYLIALQSTDPGGYTLTAVGGTGYAVAFDGSGRIRWYRYFPDLVSRQVLQLENDNFAAYCGTSTGSQPDYGEYKEFKPSGEIVGDHKAPRPLYTDGHDLVVTVSGGMITQSHLFSYNHRIVDMSQYGGPTNAQIAGHQILRLSPSGSIEWSWDGWDHFTLDDWIEEPLSIQTNPIADFDHPNSLYIDQDGHYVASWRHLAEVSKINSVTGDFIWRLGGRNNQFTFVGDTFGEFNGQHSATMLENGNLLLYDNGLRHNPQETRAVEYALDTNAMTATMVWEFRHNPAIYTPFVGSVQRLTNGNTLVGFGGAGTVTEVDPAGNVVWEATLFVEGTMTTFYRGRRIRSLYQYEKP